MSCDIIEFHADEAASGKLVLNKIITFLDTEARYQRALCVERIEKKFLFVC